MVVFRCIDVVVGTLVIKLRARQDLLHALDGGLQRIVEAIDGTVLNLSVGAVGVESLGDGRPLRGVVHLQAACHLVAVDDNDAAVLRLVIAVAVEAVLRTALTRLRRVGQHNGAVVEEVLNLAVEVASLDVDVLRAGSLHIRTEFIVGSRLVDVFLHQHMERAVGLWVETEAQALQAVVILHRRGVDNDELRLVVGGDEESVAGLHREQVVVHVGAELRGCTGSGLVVVEHLAHRAHVLIYRGRTED